MNINADFLTSEKEHYNANKIKTNNFFGNRRHTVLDNFHELFYELDMPISDKNINVW